MSVRSKDHNALKQDNGNVCPHTMVSVVGGHLNALFIYLWGAKTVLF